MSVQLHGVGSSIAPRSDPPIRRDDREQSSGADTYSVSYMSGEVTLFSSVTEQYDEFVVSVQLAASGGTINSSGGVGKRSYADTLTVVAFYHSPSRDSTV